jgi:high affinity Mn2+ porin
MGSYRAVVNDPSLSGDITATRRYRLSEGFVVNIEQAITQDLGAFLRVAFGIPVTKPGNFPTPQKA